MLYSSSLSRLRGPSESLGQLGQLQELDKEGGLEADEAGGSEGGLMHCLLDLPWGGTSQCLDMKGVNGLPWSLSYMWTSWSLLKRFSSFSPNFC